MLLLNNNIYLFAYSFVFMSSILRSANTSFGTIESNKQLGSEELEIKENVVNDTNNEILALKNNDILSRKKRWLAPWMCFNYPLCCDYRGRDTCSFFCPVCPVKRDYCKYTLQYRYDQKYINICVILKRNL